MPASLMLDIDNRLYRIAPSFSLVLDIEDEMGSLPKLRQVFSGSDWSVADLVTLIHMLISASGQIIDYKKLGDLMVQGGIKKYHAFNFNFFWRRFRT